MLGVGGKALTRRRAFLISAPVCVVLLTGLTILLTYQLRVQALSNEVGETLDRLTAAANEVQSRQNDLIATVAAAAVMTQELRPALGPQYSEWQPAGLIAGEVGVVDAQPLAIMRVIIECEGRIVATRGLEVNTRVPVPLSVDPSSNISREKFGECVASLEVLQPIPVANWRCRWTLRLQFGNGLTQDYSFDDMIGPLSTRIVHRLS
jgi:hypothetical protein